MVTVYQSIGLHYAGVYLVAEEVQLEFVSTGMLQLLHFRTIFSNGEEEDCIRIEITFMRDLASLNFYDRSVAWNLQHNLR